MNMKNKIYVGLHHSLVRPSRGGGAQMHGGGGMRRQGMMEQCTQTWDMLNQMMGEMHQMMGSHQMTPEQQRANAAK